MSPLLVVSLPCKSPPPAGLFVTHGEGRKNGSFRCHGGMSLVCPRGFGRFVSMGYELVGTILIDGIGVLVALGGLTGGEFEIEIRSREGAAGTVGSVFVAGGTAGGSAFSSAAHALKPATMENIVVFITLSCRPWRELNQLYSTQPAIAVMSRLHKPCRRASRSDGPNPPFADQTRLRLMQVAI